MKRLILFDIDGTLIRYRASASRELFSRVIYDIFGKSININNFPDFSGMTDLQILFELTGKIGIPKSELHSNIEIIWERLLALFERYCNSESLILLPGIEVLLYTLRNDPDTMLGLQTGNFKQNAYLKLKIFNLDKFFSIGAFGSDRRDRNKLPPLAIKRANKHIRQNIFTNKNTLVIGDSIRDIECAKSNNIRVLAVATGNTDTNELMKHNPDGLLPDFADCNQCVNLIYKLLH